MDPLVIGLVCAPEGVMVNVWDGSHRTGTAATLGLTHLPVVLGVPPNMTWDQVPAALKQTPAMRAVIVQALGPEPATEVAARRAPRPR